MAKKKKNPEFHARVFSIPATGFQPFIDSGINCFVPHIDYRRLEASVNGYIKGKISLAELKSLVDPEANDHMFYMDDKRIEELMKLRCK